MGEDSIPDAPLASEEVEEVEEVLSENARKRKEVYGHGK